MKILSVHNEYLIKGGEDESRRAESLVMEENGHQVTYYTKHNSKLQEYSKIQSAINTVWSKESYNEIRAILKKEKHDVMHVQNFFPLVSPSIYYAARAEKVPIVQAIRNYRLICPAYTLYRDGHVCQECVGKTMPYPGIVHKCYRDSQSASAVVASMLAYHNVAKSWNSVSQFVAVSEFVKNKLIMGGLPADKIVVKPNFVFPDPGVQPVKDDFILYVGRLQHEKGISNLLKAMALLKDNAFKLKIIGSGPLDTEVHQYTQQFPFIEYLGEKKREEAYEIMGKARALVIPSVWHEPFGRVVVEAFAKGTPVIGANMGGIPELIENGVTGYVYQADSPQSLADKIKAIYADDTATANMGINAREMFLAQYTPEINYKFLMDIYERAMASYNKTA